MRIGGKVEAFTRRSVSGWLAIFGEPSERPRLELLLDGVALASAAAEDYRPDVAAKGLGDGLCHFKIAVPDGLTADEMRNVRLRIVGSEMYLELPRQAADGVPAGHTEPGRAISPVFIVGSPRSGTSVLTRALVAAGYHGFEEGNLLGLSQMIEQRVDWYFDANDATSPATLLGSVSKATLKSQLFGVFKEVLEQFNPIDPWFDKTGNPETILLLPRVMETWPDSRVLFARRRGIENVISRVVKFPERSFSYHCNDWAANMRAWRLTRGQLERERWLEVDQREILETPESVAEKMGSLLCLDENQKSNVSRVFRTQRPQETFPGSASRFMCISETNWTEEQISVFEELCGEEMRSYDYYHP